MAHKTVGRAATTAVASADSQGGMMSKSMTGQPSIVARSRTSALPAVKRGQSTVQLDGPPNLQRSVTGGARSPALDGAEDRATNGRGGTTMEASSAFPDEYRRGKWNNRSRFLPTIQNAEENLAVCGQLKRMVEAGNLDGVRLLLHAGVPPDLAIGEYRRSALHIATERNDGLMCQLLLSFAADPHQKDTTPAVGTTKGAWTPLEMATENQHLPLVHLFAMQVNGVASLDVGPNPVPSGRSHPLRLDLQANERGFMPSLYGEAAC